MAAARHGTPSGWRAHQTRGERPCDPCYFAKQAYDAERLSAPDKALRNRRRAKAQQAAHTYLARKYRGEYLSIYHREIARLEQEAD